MVSWSAERNSGLIEKILTQITSESIRRKEPGNIGKEESANIRRKEFACLNRDNERGNENPLCWISSDDFQSKRSGSPAWDTLTSRWKNPTSLLQ